jgi:hypothetical protein
VLAVLLAPRGAGPGTERRALALSASFLRRHPLHTLTFAGHSLVVLSSRDGANRVYSSEGVTFVRQTSDTTLRDAEGRAWAIAEDALTLEGGEAETRPRIPARRAFWFGWHAQFPETELVR